LELALGALARGGGAVAARLRGLCRGLRALGALDRHGRARRQLAVARVVQLRAPVDGVIGNRRARVGAYATAASQLLVVVPSHGLWIDANFKEDQLARLRVGQAVEVRADVEPGRAFKGHVESVAPATGAQFSVLPPENATGNFTKIVQRVPVRITLDGRDGELGLLRPGLSVKASIDTKAS
ncbi:MAG TPA: HlyD family secretion protein, partial [Burkholderiaceae bacterium]